MVNIIKEDLDIEEALKKKLEFICSFCNTSCEIKNGSIRTIEKTNLSYLGLWESIHNENFKGGEFDTFKNEAGSNTFKMSPQKWIRETNAPPSYLPDFDIS